jgi:hypothetical protein
MMRFITTNKQQKRSFTLTILAFVLAFMALMIAWRAFSLAGQVKQGVVDQCNLLTNILDDSALRVYCTQLYLNEAA